jgi:dihydroflavonol-4-reductase
MHNVLVTGASSFLGYHVAKQLNAQSIRPRVLELRDSQLAPLSRLDVTRCEGHLEDARALDAACDGVDTVFHMAFKVSVGGGTALFEEMKRINLEGTRRLLDTAAAKGVARAVVASSALAVGVNRRPQPLDETASWSEHGIDLPYAIMRRQVEQEALARTRPGFAVVAVCPSFTMGPDDPVGAPANTLLKTLINGKQRFSLSVGVGCLDVRDFANGAVRAAERGHPGQRYLISGHNVTASQLLEQAGAVAGVRAPRFTPPRALLSVLVGAVGIFSRLRRKPPPVTSDVLQVIGRYAWYDTSRARADLGWEPRPLRQTLEDTVRWLRDQP